MRVFGGILLGAGALVGAAVGLALLAGVFPFGLGWLVAIGLVKLTLVASAAMMGGGAALLRIARRREQRKLDEGGRAPSS